MSSSLEPTVLTCKTWNQYHRLKKVWDQDEQPIPLYNTDQYIMLFNVYFIKIKLSHSQQVSWEPAYIFLSNPVLNCSVF